MPVLLVSNYSFLSLSVTRCLGGAGLDVHVMGPDGWPTVRFSRHCRKYTQLPLDFFRAPYDGALERIQRYCREHRIDVVVPADMDAHLLLTTVQDRLSGVKVFPVSTAELLNRMNDKWQFAEFCVANGIAHPRTRRIDRLEQLDELDWSKPLMIKPILGANSEGVAKMGSREELDRHIASAGRTVPFLMQEFSPGIDIDMSVLGDHGRLVAWTIQVVGADPQTRDFVHNDQVYELGRALVEKSGYHGVAHFDMRAANGEAFVLECNPRFWLSCPFSMWAGVNFAGLGVRMALGESPGTLLSGMIEGPCSRPSLGVKSLAQGLLNVAAMNMPSRAAFRDMYADPAPQVMAKAFSMARRVGLRSADRY